MPTTILVMRDVADRYRGFVASVMLEVAPGVYVGPALSAGVRERLWSVVTTWWQEAAGGSVLLAWRDREATGGLALRVLGAPPVELVALDGLFVVRRAVRLPPTAT